MRIKKMIMLAAFAASIPAMAGVVNVGKASYADVFPGAGEAGNRLPSADVYVTGNAALRPLPTSDWWTQELVSAHGNNIFNYPLAVRPLDAGMCILRANMHEAMPQLAPLTIGVEGISASATKVADYSDWTVTIRWESASGNMDATVGMGMPMVYFTKTSSAPVVVNTMMGTLSASGNILIISSSYNGANYAIYAPSGSTWTISGNRATSSLNDKSYWSAMILPEGDATQLAAKFAANAFVFPKGTKAESVYDAARSEVVTTYSVTPDVKEGASATPLIGLLPHHWAHLDASSAQPEAGVYKTVRGELRMMSAPEFKTRLPFRGIMPQLPDFCADTEGYSSQALISLIDRGLADTGFQDWTDSYNDGLLLNRLAQLGRIAKAIGYEAGFQKATAEVKKQLERWLTYQQGDTDFMFYYDNSWNAMLGFRAGHGQDHSINDHDFHWGYFIQAALFLGENDAQWLADWGGMIDLLVRDANSWMRSDDMFPYQRCFSPFAGHSFANGFSVQPLGADEESTSEAMNFLAAMILWGQLRGNTDMRDAAIAMHSICASAIEEYWFDANQRNFKVANYTRPVVGILTTNWCNYGTYWTADPGAMHGIQIFPTQASSMYLGDNPDMARRHWENLKSETGVASFDNNPNLWYDTWIRYVAMFSPNTALNLYRNCPASLLGTKFGDSQAHTYFWIHTLAALGTQYTVTGDYPLSRTFVDANGDVTYMACNYSSSPIQVRFSDGHTLSAAPNAITTDVAEGAGTPFEEIEDNPSQGGNQGGDDNPDQPGQGGDVKTLSITSSAASEGEFAAPYIVKMSTQGNSVTIEASFPGNYVGFVGPWLWNETSGFAEKEMQSTGTNAGKCTLTGYNTGDVIKFRLKIAFAGGLAVTAPIEYTVGSGDSSAVPFNMADSSEEWFTLQGLRINRPTAPGIYIRRQANNTSKVRIF